MPAGQRGDDACEGVGKAPIERHRLFALDAARGDLLLPAAAQAANRGEPDRPAAQPPARAHPQRTVAAPKPCLAAAKARALRARRRSPRGPRRARRARCRAAARTGRKTRRTRRETAARWPRTGSSSPARSSSTPPAAAGSRRTCGSQSVDVGQRLDRDAQRFLLREVLGPDASCAWRDRPGAW